MLGRTGAVETWMGRNGRIPEMLGGRIARNWMRLEDKLRAEPMVKPRLPAWTTGEVMISSAVIGTQGTAHVWEEGDVVRI